MDVLREEMGRLKLTPLKFYQSMDLDGSQSISRKEFHQAVDKLNMDDEDVTKAAVNKVFDILAGDSAGHANASISYDDFKAAMKKPTAAKADSKPAEKPGGMKRQNAVKSKGGKGLGT